ncbi:uncharacterized protein LOC126842489 [Adelges cooleyi]|uniref:uncharacterized protein LOC126842489 n=1 Tax=Adelges cooleyi TaxID=133065 RepID=UPI0021808232|nr:uncharacterized protein LOC126842489 [Adelges cooleyi]
MNALLVIGMCILRTVCADFRYHVDTLSDTQSGLYYEKLDSLKVQTKEVTLLTYLDLSQYNQNAQLLEARVNASYEYCEHFTKSFSPQLASINESYINSIHDHCVTLNTQARVSLSSIVNKTDLIFRTIEPSRSKRGIPFKLLSKAARLLFGLCSELCIQNSDKIIDKALSGEHSVLPILTKVLGLPNITSKQPSVDTLEMISAYDQNNTIGDLDRVRIDNALALNALLNQFSLEANTLFEILQSARLGYIHPSLINDEAILEQLKSITDQFDPNTELPYALSLRNIPKLLKVSKLAIYYSNDRVVLKIGIPLTYDETLDVFHILPHPVCINHNCVFIKPKFHYIAMTASRKLYSTFERIDQVECQQTDEFRLCPEIYPLHLTSNKPLCEALLFQELDTAPAVCDITFNQLGTTVFYKLTHQNKWYFISNGESILITCSNSTNKSLALIDIMGTGILTLNETCKAYGADHVLIPSTPTNEQDNYGNYIANVTIKEASILTSALADQILDPFQSPIRSITDFLNTGKTLSQLQLQQNLLQAPNKHFYYNYILFIICSINLLMILAIIYLHDINHRNSLRQPRRQIVYTPGEEEGVELRGVN